ncbi:MAG: DUF488 domain-containing protein [Dehalococcoidia bacterium]
MAGGEVYTIGHSNHAFERFVELLRQHEIAVLADVRSAPVSTYSPQFNRDALRGALGALDIRYSFLGKELGGRPNGSEYYDDSGHVRYYAAARAAFFNEGIVRLEKASARYRIALLCAEEDPSGCHRTLLIARVLAGREVEVRHIRGDGRLEPSVAAATPGEGAQLALFSPPVEETWRSVRSVLRESPRPSSSDS